MILKQKLYLASASPRRKAILTQLGFSFAVAAVPVHESLEGPLDEALKALARRKAEAAAQTVREGLILAADTVVVLEGRVFGKPADNREAAQMLRALSGTVHQVKTGVCVMDGRSGNAVCAVETTDVTFTELTQEDIAWYIATGEPADKAGAYAVQGLGARFVRRIGGCYYNVVGLPIVTTLSLLRAMDAPD